MLTFKTNVLTKTLCQCSQWPFTVATHTRVAYVGDMHWKFMFFCRLGNNGLILVGCCHNWKEFLGEVICGMLWLCTPLIAMNSSLIMKIVMFMTVTMMMMMGGFFQYTEMMEQFKELHKTVEELRTSGLSTGEMKKVCPTLTLFFFWKI